VPTGGREQVAACDTARHRQEVDRVHPSILRQSRERRDRLSTGQVMVMPPSTGRVWPVM
jgi:hypothetical protein